jgi:SAM-dependent methyltransferase
MERRLWTIYDLNLHKSRPLNILDLGTGFGYFPYACNYYGHNAIGLDLDVVPMYNDITKFIGIDRKVHKIKSFENLPDYGVKFDLITAFMVCFNNHKEEDVWDIQEWDFFLKDVACNRMNSNGRIFLILNSELNGEYYTETLHNYFVENGAKIDGNNIYFSSVNKFMN